MNTMTDYARNLATLLVRELKGFEAELDLFPDDMRIWETVPGLSNSAANLALHVAGNLQHFVGAVLGQSGYVRNRDAEFSRSSGTRAEIAAELQAAARVVERVLPGLSAEVLASRYPHTVVAGKEIQTGLFLQHLCSHAAFHLGQAGYARRALLSEARSSGPVSLVALMQPA
jgi:uncharacterized damage-inducible protein DinB